MSDPQHDRLLDLLSALVDGTLTESARDELEAILRADPSARLLYKRYLDLHFEASFGWVDAPELTPAAAQPAAPNKRPITRLLILAAAAAVALAFTLWTAFRPDTTAPGLAPVVTAVSSETPLALEPGQSLEPGTTVNLTATGDTLELRYPDGTLATAFGPANFEVLGSEQDGKRITLSEGTLTADVAPQHQDRPFLVSTPHTGVRILGTRLAISAAGDAGTRVDLHSGKIELLREAAEPLPVTPGSVAFVPAETTQPITVNAHPTTLESPARQFDVPGIDHLGFTADGQTLLAHTRKNAVSVTPDDRVESLPVRTASGHGTYLYNAAGPIVAGTSSHDQTTFLWDHASDTFTATVPAAGDRPRFPAAVSPDGRFLVTTPARGDHLTFRLHQLGTGATTIGREQKISAYAFSPDGLTLAAGLRRIGHSSGNTIELFDLTDPQQPTSTTLDVERSHPLSLTFSADGHHLAVGLSGELQLWDLRTAERTTVLDELGHAAHTVALSPDATLAAVASPDGDLWVWDTATGATLSFIPGDANTVRALAFSPDGRSLAIASTRTLTVWNLPQ